MAIAQDDALGATAGGPATSRYDVAVVEPDPRYRMRLGTQLAGAAQFESIEELVQHLRPGRPVVVVFGPSVAVPIGFEQVQRLVVAYPELGAVFAVGDLSAPVLQAALRAGARDTVAAHDAASMVQSVARVGDLLHDSTVSRVPAVVESRANPGRLIVVFSTKGGVGKSTIAINVAVAMARRTDERVALVDADLHFGDIAVLLGIPPQTTITDAAASIQFADPGMLSTMLTRHESGVYVLPAPAEAVLGTTLAPEELAGISACREDRVITQPFRVAVAGALLVLADDLGDGRVDIDNKTPGARPGTENPRTAEHLAGDLVELADMPERERTQERPQRRGCHHPEPQHPLRRTRAQHVRVVDVRAASQDRRHQREDLTARQRATDPAHQPHRRIDQRLQPETRHQRRRQDQTRVGHQGRIIEDHLDPVDRARYSTHWKCLPGWRPRRLRTPSSSQPREAFPRIRAYLTPRSSVDRGSVDAEAPSGRSGRNSRRSGRAGPSGRGSGFS